MERAAELIRGSGWCFLLGRRLANAEPKADDVNAEREVSADYRDLADHVARSGPEDQQGARLQRKLPIGCDRGGLLDDVGVSDERDEHRMGANAVAARLRPGAAFLA